MKSSKISDSGKVLTRHCLLSSGLKSETEWFLIVVKDQFIPGKITVVAQDVAFVINKLKPLILFTPICSPRTPTEYLNMHDKEEKYIHWGTCKALDLLHDKNTDGNTNNMKGWKIIPSFKETERNVNRNGMILNYFRNNNNVFSLMLSIKTLSNMKIRNQKLSECRHMDERNRGGFLPGNAQMAELQK